MPEAAEYSAIFLIIFNITALCALVIWKVWKIDKPRGGRPALNIQPKWSDETYKNW